VKLTLPLFLASFLLVILLTACGGQATSEPGSYVSPDGKFTFGYAPEWNLVILEADAILDVSRSADSPDVIQLEVMPPLPLASYTEAGLGTSVNEIVNARAQLWQRFGPSVSTEINIQSAEVTAFTVGEYPAAYAYASIPGDAGITFGIMVLAIQVTADDVVTITALPPQGQDFSVLVNRQAQILEVANSVRYTP
jgi:hypothetical protein